ncbi:dynein assembly factor with WDR repeat domains 1-like [Acipenser ruthenus]|uniref:dynein assembly factor with WDR repeat domains 1-like n=1 Tax=Acipenser ruthenus TaxID=7906 RepID=UPI0027421D7D|nr:dynein assembly factor with WDR repeat domains 1-like [Acipenser ruthenus]
MHRSYSSGKNSTIYNPCALYELRFFFLFVCFLIKGTARVYSASSQKCIAKLEGHENDISKLCFNPQGSHILTGSADKTARMWDPHTGQCLQILEGHTDEIFSCAFNYEGNTIITGSKDNTCRIWR